jgi:hypothetical protein
MADNSAIIYGKNITKEMFEAYPINCSLTVVDKGHVDKCIKAWEDFWALIDDSIEKAKERKLNG